MTTAAAAVSVEVCDVCAHPVELHDPIALRFCKATLALAASRGCICRPAS